MPNRDDILWFKTQFKLRLAAAVAGTPLTIDFLTAIACHETGHIWSVLRRKGLPVDRVLALCVGDTLDSDKGRRAFPKTKADLLAVPRGAEMFAIAHQALVDMAQHVPGFAAVAARPAKFCHAFGLFQRDLQFFRVDPGYFISRDWERFEPTLEQCLGELNRALVKLGFAGRDGLSDSELAAVGIAYNTGGFTPSKGLKQGHFDGTKFYGEALLDFLRLAHTVEPAGQPAAIDPPELGEAIVAPPTPLVDNGLRLRVSTLITTLNLRREPRVSDPNQANVIGQLPDGHPVQAITGKARNGFIEVETSLHGAFLRGFAAKKFLVPEDDAAKIAMPIPVLVPAQTPPSVGIVAVTMPRKPGTVTRRRDLATAHSLNEGGQPGRNGASAQELRQEAQAIVDWLAVDAPPHLRYQPRNGLTFCNIYAHDYCHLAGVYLPRVWWTVPALLELAKGRDVQALIGNTITELRANDLFRWLRDHGQAFGWRQTGTLSKLQTEVNQGAVGLIIARRKEDGRSGHVTMVVPETDSARARRSLTGEVTAPLQSQAGARNFRRGLGATGWWNGELFAESAFWLHA